MIRLKVKTLRTFREKSVGLIGAESISPVMFTTRWGIHTFGVRHPIDVLILDTHNRVVCMKKSLPPNRFFLWNPRYYTVIEVPAGTVHAHDIKVGSQISPEQK